MKVLKFAVVLLAIGVLSTTAIAAPEDDCTGAVPAPTPVDPCSDTTPTGPLGSCTSGDGVKDVWVTFVASAAAHRVRTDVASTGTDSDFIVYSGTCGNLTEIGCAEDISSSNFLSNTCVGGLTPGTTYYLQVGTWADGCPNGPYVVTIEAASGAICGDGVISCVPGAEQCDDGNTVGGDCCSATCQREEICGNGCREGAEECDDGNLIDGDGCSSTCRRPVCGDNIIDIGEECDGTSNAACPVGGSCNSICRCIDGIPAVSEWGLAVLTLIGLVSGTILFGRRRAAVH